MPKIILKDFNLWGYSDSEYQGTANSVQELVGFDIHSEPGILKVNQKLKNDFSTNELIIQILPCSDGNTYLFSGETGKIWQRTPVGVYSVVATNAQWKMYDACEFDWYIYYSSFGYLGRWQIGTNWSTRQDTFGEFTKKDAHFHPIKELNLTLYIGDSNLVAVVEDGVFIPDWLDLPKWHRIKALGKVVNDLAIWTFKGDNINDSEIFRWNTWSVSWSTSDPVPEAGVNSFLSTDNYILVQVGNKGNLYMYTGEVLQKQKRIPWDWRTGKAEVKQNATDSYFWLPLFWISNVSWNPIKQGIFSYGGYAINYPSVLNLEYPLANGETTDVIIWALRVTGDTLMVSWKKWEQAWVDIIDYSNKQPIATIKSRKINLDREDLKNFGVSITWRTKPTWTDIKLYVSVNNTDFREIELTHDAKRNMSYSKVNIEGGTTMKMKVEAHSSANLSPEIEDVIINLK